MKFWCDVLSFFISVTSSGYIVRNFERRRNVLTLRAKRLRASDLTAFWRRWVLGCPVEKKFTPWQKHRLDTLETKYIDVHAGVFYMTISKPKPNLMSVGLPVLTSPVDCMAIVVVTCENCYNVNVSGVENNDCALHTFAYSKLKVSVLDMPSLISELFCVTCSAATVTSPELTFDFMPTMVFTSACFVASNIQWTRFVFSKINETSLSWYPTFTEGSFCNERIR